MREAWRNQNIKGVTEVGWPTLRPESRGLPVAEEFERLGYWDNSVYTGGLDSRHSREDRGRSRLRRRGGHLVSTLDPSDQHVPGSVELMIPRV